MRLRVLVADDQELVRSALVALVATDPSLEVVGEAGSGAEALRLAERLRPDVVVLDVRMPDVSGLEATRGLAGLTPRPSIVAVSAEVSAPLRRQLEEAGAAAVVDKTELFERLLPTLHAAAAQGPAPRPPPPGPATPARRER